MAYITMYFKFTFVLPYNYSIIVALPWFENLFEDLLTIQNVYRSPFGTETHIIFMLSQTTHNKVASDHQLFSPKLLFVFSQYIVSMVQCLSTSVINLNSMTMVC